MADKLPTTGSNLGGTLTGVANLANLFLGSTTNQNTGGTTTSSGGTTTQTDSGTTTTVTSSESVSPDAVNALVKSILEGANGLAAVAGGQKNAGLYNSSTNQMLTNDLISRAAAEGAKLNKTNTQTSTTGPRTQTTVTPQTSQSTAQNTTAIKQPPITAAQGLTGLAALQLGAPLLKGIKLPSLGSLGIGGSESAGTYNPDMGPFPEGSDKYNLNLGGSDGVNVSTTGADVVSDPIAQISADITSSSVDAAPEIASDVINAPDFSPESGTVSSDGFDFSGITDFASGVGDSLGDFAASATDSASSFIDDFDFGGFFADGGHVKPGMMDAYKKKYADGGAVTQSFQQSTMDKRMGAESAEPGSQQVQSNPADLTPQTPQERAAVYQAVSVMPIIIQRMLGGLGMDTKAKPQGKADGGMVSHPKPKGYADGGQVTDVTDKRGNQNLKDVAYLANTGLRPEDARMSQGLGSESNAVAINNIISQSLRPRRDLAVAGSKTGVSSNSAGRGFQVSGAREPSVVGYNSSAGGINSSTALLDSSAGDGTASAANPDAADVAGIGEAIANNPGLAKGAAAVASQLSGIPGLSGIMGLASSKNSTEAAKSIGLTALGIANPVLAGVFSVISSILEARDRAADVAATESPFGGMSTPGTSVDTQAANAAAGITSSTISGPMSSVPGMNASIDPLSGIESISSESVDADTDVSSDSIDGGSPDGGGVGAGDGSGEGPNGNGSYKNGGHIQGPGSGVSDDIPAMLSDGEYVIPADVVEALGVPFFDSLRAKYHTPAAMQKRG